MQAWGHGLPSSDHFARGHEPAQRPQAHPASDGDRRAAARNLENDPLRFHLDGRLSRTRFPLRVKGKPRDLDGPNAGVDQVRGTTGEASSASGINWNMKSPAANSVRERGLGNMALCSVYGASQG